MADPKPTSDSTPYAFDTKLIHAGQSPDPITGAVVTPINLTTTYAQQGLGRHKGYEYSRSHNPTRRALEENVAALENGAAGFAFASGMAAITTVTSLLSAGDHVVSEENVYGGTVRYFQQIASRFGIEFTFVDASDVDAIAGAMGENTKMVYLESPTNPNLKVADLGKACALARDHGAMSVVDNTFATPYLQRPIDLGADVVIHSATKYLGGHSDTVSGLAVARTKELAQRIWFIQNASGGILSPFDSYLVLRGIKTLAVRMDRHCRSAMDIARWLEAHPKVEKVFYPGLGSHPQHALATRQMKAFGGMVSFELHGGEAAASRAAESVRLWTLGESLGAVESLMSYPWAMTHAAVPEEQRLRSGVTPGLLRLSVGLEDVEDLKRDLDEAFRKA